jgi:hypothetical protein
MPASALQINGLQIQSLKRSEILAPQAREVVKELSQRRAFALSRLGEAIVRVEWPRFAVLQDDPSPRYPVRPLADD